MNYVSIKTSYNQLKELSTTGKAYPADGAVFLVHNFKQLFIGHTLDAILSTWIADFHFSTNVKQLLQKELADSIEWEGPFVFVINDQKMFIDFSAPAHYEIGINSQSISEIIDISSQNISELKKLRNSKQFVDISFLYGNEILGQRVKNIHTVVDNKHETSVLLAVIIELENNFCLVVSEKIDNPMLRIYSDIQTAKQSIEQQKNPNFRF